MDQDRESNGELSVAKGVYEHVLLMWEDQVRLADGLNTKRRSHTALLGFLFAIGLFQFRLYRPAGESLVLDGSALGLVRGLLLVILAGLFIAIYWLNTQSPIVRRAAFICFDHGSRFCTFFWRAARAKSPQVQESIQKMPPRPSPWPSGRASSRLLTDDESLDDWFVLDELELWWIRTDRLREAYRALTIRNDRVKRRLASALMVILAVFALLSVVLGMYIWSITRG